LGFEQYWVLSFVGFIRFFLFAQAVGKLVGKFSSSAKLLFGFTSTLDYLTNSQIHYLLVVRSCKHRDIFNYYWLDKQNSIKFGMGFCRVFQSVLLGYYPGV